MDPEAPYCSPRQSFVYHTPVTTTTFMKKGKKSKRNNMNRAECRRIILQYDVKYAYLEQVHAMPGQGVTGMFRFGQNFGQWQGLLTGMGFEDEQIIEVPPQTWKSKMKLRSAEKTVARDTAGELFPLHESEFKRVKDDGVAESLLIALYGCYDQKYTPDLGTFEPVMKVII